MTVEHFRGSSEIPEQPLRIAALDPNYVDATMLLGAELVAYTEYRKGDNPFPEYLGDISDLTDEAVNVGTIAEPDLEKILEAEPNLIISADVRQGEMYDQLNKIDPTVFSESTGPTWKENVVLLGEALGKKEEAEAKVAAYEARAAAVGAEILEQHPDTTYSFLRFAGEDTLRLYSSNSFIGEIMADTGIPRPEGQPDTDESILVELSQENLLDGDATFIMESMWAPRGRGGRRVPRPAGFVPQQPALGRADRRDRRGRRRDLRLLREHPGRRRRRHRAGRALRRRPAPRGLTRPPLRVPARRLD